MMSWSRGRDWPNLASRATLDSGTMEPAMSLRSLAALGLLLLLWGCNTLAKPTSDPSINEIEHRHDEMMRGVGGGGGGGGSM
jgi:hypothetical protein